MTSRDTSRTPSTLPLGVNFSSSSPDFPLLLPNLPLGWTAPPDPTVATSDSGVSPPGSGTSLGPKYLLPSRPRNALLFYLFLFPTLPLSLSPTL